MSWSRTWSADGLHMLLGKWKALNKEQFLLNLFKNDCFFFFVLVFFLQSSSVLIFNTATSYSYTDQSFLSNCYTAWHFNSVVLDFLWWHEFLWFVQSHMTKENNDVSTQKYVRFSIVTFWRLIYCMSYLIWQTIFA